MAKIWHPKSRKRINGQRLQPGEELRKTDVYDSSDGTWRARGSDYPGFVPPGNHVTWVRPTSAPSN